MDSLVPYVRETDSKFLCAINISKPSVRENLFETMSAVLCDIQIFSKYPSNNIE